MYDVVDVVGRADRFGFQNFCSPSKYTYHTIQAANIKGADQTARMRRLICTFVVRIWHKTHFRMTWPKYEHCISHGFFVSNERTL